MANQNTVVGGAFSVQFLKNGDQVNVVRQVLKMVDDEQVSTETHNLVQVFNKSTKSVLPDWTKNPPVVAVSLQSASGKEVYITGIRWSIDKKPFMKFAGDGMSPTFQPDSEGLGFFAKVSEMSKVAYLKIKRNMALVSNEESGNKQISFEVDYISGASNLTATGHFDVEIQMAGNSSYRLVLSANPSQFTENNSTVKITAEAWLGTQIQEINGTDYTVEWKDNEKVLPNDPGTFNQLTIKEEDVESCCRIVATLLGKDKVPLAKESITVQDVTDTYRLSPSPVEGQSSTVSITEDKEINAVWQLNMLKMGNSGTHTEIVPNEKINYSWKIYNSKEELKGTSENPVIPDKSIVTITPAMCLIRAHSDKRKNEYGDVDVEVAAEILP